MTQHTSAARPAATDTPATDGYDPPAEVCTSLAGGRHGEPEHDPYLCNAAGLAQMRANTSAWREREATRARELAEGQERERRYLAELTERARRRLLSPEARREEDETARWVAMTREQREAVWAREAARDARKAEARRKRWAGELPPRPGTWDGHLMWLRVTFGRREFTTLAVRDTALKAEGEWVRPPRYPVKLGYRESTTREFDPFAPDFALRLGQGYAKIAGELIDEWISITPTGTTGNRRRWRVLAEDPGAQ